MRLKIALYKKKGQWRWRMTTMNNTIVGSSTETYAQRVGCIKNFHLCTGWDIGKALIGRLDRYDLILKFNTGRRSTHSIRAVV